MGFSRIGGVAAVGFASWIDLGNMIVAPAGLPLTGADISEITTFFATKGVVLGVGAMLAPAAWALAALFGAVAVLWPSGRERGEALSLLGFAGLVLQNAAFAGVIAIRLALVSLSAHDRSATAGLWALREALFTLKGAFLALALIGLFIGGLHADLIRPWHGAVGLLSAALLFGSATLALPVMNHAGPFGLVGWLLWVVWIVKYGITLNRLNPCTSASGRTSPDWSWRSYSPPCGSLCRWMSCPAGTAPSCTASTSCPSPGRWSMRIIADTNVCISAAVCALTAPEVFDQGDNDGLVTVFLSDPPEELREAVAEAVRLCPSGALDIR